MERSPPGRLDRRRILLVAHDFPPVRSPQAIRATFLCKGLLDAGADVVVLSRSGVADEPLPPVLSYSTSVLTVHRCSPGLFEAIVSKIVHRRRPAPTLVATPPTAPIGPMSLNWKGRWVGRIRRALGWLHFPDERSAWVPAARRWLTDRAPALGIDAAVLMHEPAAGVRLWKDVEALSIPWWVDLADPVLAPYTRRHWRNRAFRLEGELVRHAGGVSVTNGETAILLANRHGVEASSFHVLPQGYLEAQTSKGTTSPDLLLAYTGRFYRFRPASALVEAVLHSEGVRLRIAGPELPADVIDAARCRPDKIQLLGELSHDQALQAQCDADVLVSVGNRGTAQTPGKVIEYFGASRPILHLASDNSDPIPALLASLRRGVSCANESADVMAVLERLASLKRAGILHSGFDLRPETVKDYAWPTIGQRFAGLIASMLQSRGNNTDSSRLS